MMLVIALLLGAAPAWPVLVQAPRPQPARPSGIYAAAPRAALDLVPRRLIARYGRAGLGPLALELARRQPIDPEGREAALVEATAAAEAAVRAETDALLLVAAAASSEDPEYPALVAALYAMQEPYAPYLDAEQANAADREYRAARARLSEEQRRRLDAAIARSLQALADGRDEAPSPVEAVVVDLPQIPTRLVTPRVAALRKAADEERERLKPPPPAPRLAARVNLAARVALLAGALGAKAFVARRIYRPLAERGVRFAKHFGDFWREWVTGRRMDLPTFRHAVLKGLHREGDFRGAFSHPMHDGVGEVMSPLIVRETAAKKIAAQRLRIGRDRVVDGVAIPVAPLEASALLHVSGMSYSQVSEAAHLSLLYSQIKLAKQLRADLLVNTGEGGPGLHLALLEGDAAAAERFVVEWHIANKQIRRGGWRHAAIARKIRRLLRQRDELFAEFTPEDIARVRIVAQFGSALNGIRNPDAGIDVNRLRRVAENPFVGMIQYKLKQAAKPGGKIDPSKVKDLSAAYRDIPQGRPVKSPEINPEMEDFEDIAAVVRATRVIARKPVSLKFAVGQVDDVYRLLAWLKEADALPDHIQVEGRDPFEGPGSGNAPPYGNTSVMGNESVIILDALLRRLGVRDQIVLEATGGILLPTDAVEKLMLGADMVSAARAWMQLGLGCTGKGACAKEKSCPWGITSTGESFVGLGMDPCAVAPRGYQAAVNWNGVFQKLIAQAGSDDWRTVRRTHGLHARPNQFRKQSDGRGLTLDLVYAPWYVANLLRGALTEQEAISIVFGERP